MVNKEKKNGTAVKKIFGNRTSLIFYAGLGVVIFAALIAIGRVNSYLEKYLTDFEMTRPKYTVENIFNEYFKNPDFDVLIHKAGCEVGDFENEEDLKQYFENSINGKSITHVYVAGTDKTKVNVKADGVKFASFTIQKAPETSEYGFDIYELGEIKLHYTLSSSVKIRIPFNYSVAVNGKLLGEEYKTKTGITDDKRETLPVGTYKLSYDEYEVRGLVNAPAVTVYDRKNNPVIPEYDEENGIYKVNFEYDTELQNTYEPFVLKAVENYAARIQNAGVTMNTIKTYFEYGTETYNRIKNNPGNFVWDYDSYHFENEKTGDFYAYDENTFSCSVKMTQVMCKRGAKDYREDINVTLYLRCDENGDYMIYDLATNLS